MLLLHLGVYLHACMACERELAWLISSIKEWSHAKLQFFMPEGPEKLGSDKWVINSYYGDSGYPCFINICGDFRTQLNWSAQARWNSIMSKVKEAIEWCSANILLHHSFLYYWYTMKNSLIPIAKYCVVGALLTNVRTCFHGIQIMEYF